LSAAAGSYSSSPLCRSTILNFFFLILASYSCQRF
jgi:hypothetical protein